jgi:hypothetical protein
MLPLQSFCSRAVTGARDQNNPQANSTSRPMNISQHFRECHIDNLNRHKDSAGAYCSRCSLTASTMLFPEEEAPLLKKWIVKRLENTCVNCSQQAQLKALASLQNALSLTLLPLDPMPMPMFSPTTSWRCYDTMATRMPCGLFARLRFQIS